MFKGFNVDNLQGASKIGITSVFSDPIHGRSNASLLSGLPWGFSTGLFAPGTGFDNDDFDIMYTIGGLQYYPAPATAASTPSPIPTYTPYASPQWDNGTTQNTLVFNSTNGFAGTVPTAGPDPNHLLVRGFDDENTGFDSTDAREFYATTFSVMITPLDAAGMPTTFASEAKFVFSYDGDRLIKFDEVVPGKGLWGRVQC